MKQFNIPDIYRSSFITRIKEIRKNSDRRKKDYSPTILDFERVKFIVARHFGFCYGVENAIEIAYRTIEENKGKNIYLLSEMIHNPGVNFDLKSRGVRFLMDTKGNRIIPWESLTSEDIVIIPAFGTSIEIENKLKEIGIDPYRYNTTCPFVEKVWNRAKQIGKQGATIIIHGKHNHEETRATFSHSKENSHSLIVKNLDEAKVLANYILGKISTEEVRKFFEGKYSEGFDFEKDLEKIGVVNQTTMLATETAEIADFLENTMIEKFGTGELDMHFVDTKDTLCYATNDNQQATTELLKHEGDLAIVVGGYNSSNTTHLVELLEQKFKTYFISSEEKISENEVKFFDIHKKEELAGENPFKRENLKIIITSGASCPDAVVDKVLIKILNHFNIEPDLDKKLSELSDLYKQTI